MVLGAKFLDIMSVAKFVRVQDFSSMFFSSMLFSSRFLNIMFMDNLVMGGSTVEERASNPLDHVAATHRAERRNYQNLECLQWSEKCQMGTMGL